MKPIIIVAPLVAMLISAPALAFDTADDETVKAFIETAYPRINSFSPMQEKEALATRIRYFATEKAFADFNEAKKADGTHEFVFERGGFAMDDIISKVSVFGRGEGAWQAEFIARHKSVGQDVEKAECISVRVALKELPLAAGMYPVGIESITTKPSKVKCPAG
ncbi:hypothetical protein O9X98_05050 [Agrobacterium salinitolerans]|nr:hypothetical protein [Agrobacterium salinitolerans]